MNKRVELDCIGFNVGNDPTYLGDFEVRWRKMIWLEGELLRAEPHRTVITPDTDIDGTMEAVNQHFEAMGFGRMPADDIDLVKAMAARYWTPEVIEAVALRNGASAAPAEG